MRSTILVPLLATALAAAAPASAALFVSGDVGIFSNVKENAANERFLLNLAGDGIVVLHPGQFTQFVTSDVSFVLGNAAIPHVALAWDAPVTANDLAGARLYMAYLTKSAWTLAEVNLLADFVRAGGHVLLSGDNSAFAEENAAVNALAAALGSDLFIEGAAFDEGLGAIATILEDNTFTAGTAGLRYVAASRVLGGRGLYGTADGGAVVLAYDTLAGVPEPASWAMSILGFGLVGSALRRRQAGSVRRAVA